jgi:NADH:ubiquinone oxidoreductase subunit E
VLSALLARHDRNPHRLVQILRELQALQGWLPRPTLARLASALGLTLAQVEGVAGFYRFIHLQPVGTYRVLFSDNITDRMRGSQSLMADLCRRLGVAPGKLSGDGLVSVATTSCTGMCDQGPALLVNHHQVVTQLDASRVAMLADLILHRVPVSNWPARWFEVKDNVHRADVLLGEPAPPGQALAAALARGPEATLAEVKLAKLRGCGGAGFAAATKWETCRRAANPRRVVVCNADEGEPGTFKDRVLLNRCADAVFEGMTIAALAIGAQQGFVYLRGEYRFMLEKLEGTLHAAARPACWAPASWATQASTSTSRSMSAPVPTCAARSRRWWSRWKASAARRACARPAWPRWATWACPRSSTTSRPSAPWCPSPCTAGPGGRASARPVSTGTQDPLPCRATATAPACTSTRMARSHRPRA